MEPRLAKRQTGFPGFSSPGQSGLQDLANCPEGGGCGARRILLWHLLCWQVGCSHCCSGHGLPGPPSTNSTHPSQPLFLSSTSLAWLTGMHLCCLSHLNLLRSEARRGRVHL
ncbi:uncharacterized protein LOC224098 isoform 2 [Mus musculus]|uniref:uncharacterized protein LOC224098 isoform 2 n=1 Tax=Mus musculus TaxID=10090 RepID=UPI000C1B4377|nr:uncharacterized protein LOC224098 isoform 2 [Mus musculus]